MICAKDCFTVCIHDVAPLHWAALKIIVAGLSPWVGRCLAGAVVPCWHGRPLTSADPQFIAWLKAGFNEVLLHGFSHRRERGGGPVSLLTAGADELTGLSPVEARTCLCRGQEILTASFGGPAAGFVAPAWQLGAVTPELLADCCLRYWAGLTSLTTVDGTRLPLATWSWDGGRWAWLGKLGATAGRLRHLLNRDATPCLVFHPADLRRGYLDEGLKLVQRFLAEGRRPVLLADLAASGEPAGRL